MARLELEIRNRLHSGIENAKALLKRQDWSNLVRIQEEPKAMLGVAGLVGALTVFLFFGGWKPRTINAQTMQAASQNSPQPVAAADGSVSGFASRPPQYSFSPIASNAIDLYEDSRAINGNAPSSQSELPNYSLPSKPVRLPAASPKPARIMNLSQAPVHTGVRKAHSDAQSSAQLQTLASPAQPEMLTTLGASKPLGQELMMDSSQSNTMPEPAIVQANTSTLLKASGDDIKAPKLYFEVGTFKDETWANNAVDKLTQLGFHAVLIHKNLLWTQSYHVEVGPYTNQKDIAEARQSLAAQGFKAHPVN
jgi:cell division protein FtsN